MGTRVNAGSVVSAVNVHIRQDCPFLAIRYQLFAIRGASLCERPPSRRLARTLLVLRIALTSGSIRKGAGSVGRGKLAGGLGGNPATFRRGKPTEPFLFSETPCELSFPTH